MPIRVADLDERRKPAITDVEPRDDGCAADKRGVIDISAKKPHHGDAIRIERHLIDDAGKVSGEIVLNPLRLCDAQHAPTSQVGGADEERLVAGYVGLKNDP